MLVEKYLGRLLHIEIHVFADGHGVLNSFERNCPWRRQYQAGDWEARASASASSKTRRLSSCKP